MTEYYAATRSALASLIAVELQRQGYGAEAADATLRRIMAGVLLGPSSPSSFPGNMVSSAGGYNSSSGGSSGGGGNVLHRFDLKCDGFKLGDRAVIAVMEALLKVALHHHHQNTNGNANASAAATNAPLPSSSSSALSLLASSCQWFVHLARNDLTDKCGAHLLMLIKKCAVMRSSSGGSSGGVASQSAASSFPSPGGMSLQSAAPSSATANNNNDATAFFLVLNTLDLNCNPLLSDRMRTKLFNATEAAKAVLLLGQQQQQYANAIRSTTTTAAAAAAASSSVSAALSAASSVFCLFLERTEAESHMAIQQGINLTALAALEAVTAASASINANLVGGGGGGASPQAKGSSAAGSGAAAVSPANGLRRSTISPSRMSAISQSSSSVNIDLMKRRKREEEEAAAAAAAAAEHSQQQQQLSQSQQQLRRFAPVIGSASSVANGDQQRSSGMFDGTVTAATFPLALAMGDSVHSIPTGSSNLLQRRPSEEVANAGVGSSVGGAPLTVNGPATTSTAVNTVESGPQQHPPASPALLGNYDVIPSPQPAVNATDAAAAEDQHQKKTSKKKSKTSGTAPSSPKSDASPSSKSKRSKADTKREKKEKKKKKERRSHSKGGAADKSSTSGGGGGSVATGTSASGSKGGGSSSSSSSSASSCGGDSSDDSGNKENRRQRSSSTADGGGDKQNKKTKSNKGYNAAEIILSAIGRDKKTSVTRSTSLSSTAGCAANADDPSMALEGKRKASAANPLPLHPSSSNTKTQPPSPLAMTAASGIDEALQQQQQPSLTARQQRRGSSASVSIIIGPSPPTSASRPEGGGASTSDAANRNAANADDVVDDHPPQQDGDGVNDPAAAAAANDASFDPNAIWDLQDYLDITANTNPEIDAVLNMCGVLSRQEADAGRGGRGGGGGQHGADDAEEYVPSSPILGPRSTVPSGAVTMLQFQQILLGGFVDDAAEDSDQSEDSDDDDADSDDENDSHNVSTSYAEMLERKRERRRSRKESGGGRSYASAFLHHKSLLSQRLRVAVSIVHNVTVLNISHNNLREMPLLPPTLLRLDVSNNKLSRLANLDRCPMLTVLNARRNLITSLIVEAPPAFAQQQQQQQGYAPVTFADPSGYASRSLIALNSTSNSHQKSGLSSSALDIGSDRAALRLSMARDTADAKRLREEHKRLYLTPKKAFDSTPCLAHVFLGHNRLVAIDGGALAHLVMLETLDLSFNPLGMSPAGLAKQDAIAAQQRRMRAQQQQQRNRRNANENGGSNSDVGLNGGASTSTRAPISPLSPAADSTASNGNDDGGSVDDVADIDSLIPSSAVFAAASSAVRGLSLNPSLRHILLIGTPFWKKFMVENPSKNSNVRSMASGDSISSSVSAVSGAAVFLPNSAAESASKISKEGFKKYVAVVRNFCAALMALDNHRLPQTRTAEMARIEHEKMMHKLSRGGGSSGAVINASQTAADAAGFGWERQLNGHGGVYHTPQQHSMYPTVVLPPEHASAMGALALLFGSGGGSGAAAAGYALPSKIANQTNNMLQLKIRQQTAMNNSVMASDGTFVGNSGINNNASSYAAGNSSSVNALNHVVGPLNGPSFSFNPKGNVHHPSRSDEGTKALVNGTKGLAGRYNYKSKNAAVILEKGAAATAALSAVNNHNNNNNNSSASAIVNSSGIRSGGFVRGASASQVQQQNASGINSSRRNSFTANTSSASLAALVAPSSSSAHHRNGGGQMVIGSSIYGNAPQQRAASANSRGGQNISFSSSSLHSRVPTISTTSPHRATSTTAALSMTHQRAALLTKVAASTQHFVDQQLEAKRRQLAIRREEEEEAQREYEAWLAEEERLALEAEMEAEMAEERDRFEGSEDVSRRLFQQNERAKRLAIESNAEADRKRVRVLEAEREKERAERKRLAIAAAIRRQEEEEAAAAAAAAVDRHRLEAQAKKAAKMRADEEEEKRLREQLLAETALARLEKKKIDDENDEAARRLAHLETLTKQHEASVRRQQEELQLELSKAQDELTNALVKIEEAKKAKDRLVEEEREAEEEAAKQKKRRHQLLVDEENATFESESCSDIMHSRQHTMLTNLESDDPASPDARRMLMLSTDGNAEGLVVADTAISMSPTQPTTADDKGKDGAAADQSSSSPPNHHSATRNGGARQQHHGASSSASPAAALTTQALGATSGETTVTAHGKDCLTAADDNVKANTAASGGVVAVAPLLTVQAIPTSPDDAEHDKTVSTAAAEANATRSIVGSFEHLLAMKDQQRSSSLSLRRYDEGGAARAMGASASLVVHHDGGGGGGGSSMTSPRDAAGPTAVGASAGGGGGAALMTSASGTLATLGPFSPNAEWDRSGSAGHVAALNSANNNNNNNNAASSGGGISAADIATVGGSHPQDPQNLRTPADMNLLLLTAANTTANNNVMDSKTQRTDAATLQCDAGAAIVPPSVFEQSREGRDDTCMLRDGPPNGAGARGAVPSPPSVVKTLRKEDLMLDGHPHEHHREHNHGNQSATGVTGVRNGSLGAQAAPTPTTVHGGAGILPASRSPSGSLHSPSLAAEDLHGKSSPTNTHTHSHSDSRPHNHHQRKGSSSPPCPNTTDKKKDSPLTTGGAADNNTATDRRRSSKKMSPPINAPSNDDDDDGDDNGAEGIAALRTPTTVDVPSRGNTNTKPNRREGPLPPPTAARQMTSSTVVDGLVDEFVDDEEEDEPTHVTEATVLRKGGRVGGGGGSRFNPAASGSATDATELDYADMLELNDTLDSPAAMQLAMAMGKQQQQQQQQQPTRVGVAPRGSGVGSSNLTPNSPLGGALDANRRSSIAPTVHLSQRGLGGLDSHQHSPRVLTSSTNHFSPIEHNAGSPLRNSNGNNNNNNNRRESLRAFPQTEDDVGLMPSSQQGSPSSPWGGKRQQQQQQQNSARSSPRNHHGHHNRQRERGDSHRTQNTNTHNTTTTVLSHNATPFDVIVLPDGTKRLQFRQASLQSVKALERAAIKQQREQEKRRRRREEGESQSSSGGSSSSTSSSSSSNDQSGSSSSSSSSQKDSRKSSRDASVSSSQQRRRRESGQEKDDGSPLEEGGHSSRNPSPPSMSPAGVNTSLVPQHVTTTPAMPPPLHPSTVRTPSVTNITIGNGGGGQRPTSSAAAGGGGSSSPSASAGPLLVGPRRSPSPPPPPQQTRGSLLPAGSEVAIGSSATTAIGGGGGGIFRKPLIAPSRDDFGGPIATPSGGGITVCMGGATHLFMPPPPQEKDSVRGAEGGVGRARGPGGGGGGMRAPSTSEGRTATTITATGALPPMEASPTTRASQPIGSGGDGAVVVEARVPSLPNEEGHGALVKVHSILKKDSRKSKVPLSPEPTPTADADEEEENNGVPTDSADVINYMATEADREATSASEAGEEGDSPTDADDPLSLRALPLQAKEWLSSIESDRTAVEAGLRALTAIIATQRDVLVQYHLRVNAKGSGDSNLFALPPREAVLDAHFALTDVASKVLLQRGGGGSAQQPQPQPQQEPRRSSSTVAADPIEALALSYQTAVTERDRCIQMLTASGLLKSVADCYGPKALAIASAEAKLMELEALEAELERRKKAAAGEMAAAARHATTAVVEVRASGNRLLIAPTMAVPSSSAAGATIGGGGLLSPHHFGTADRQRRSPAAPPPPPPTFDDGGDASPLPPRNAHRMLSSPVEEESAGSTQTIVSKQQKKDERKQLRRQLREVALEEVRQWQRAEFGVEWDFSAPSNSTGGGNYTIVVPPKTNRASKGHSARSSALLERRQSLLMPSLASVSDGKACLRYLAACVTQEREDLLMRFVSQ